MQLVKLVWARAGAHAEDWRQGHEAELRQLARGALHSTLGLAELS